MATGEVGAKLFVGDDLRTSPQSFQEVKLGDGDARDLAEEQCSWALGKFDVSFLFCFDLRRIVLRQAGYLPPASQDSI